MSTLKMSSSDNTIYYCCHVFYFTSKYIQICRCNWLWTNKRFYETNNIFVFKLRASKKEVKMHFQDVYHFCFVLLVLTTIFFV